MADHSIHLDDSRHEELATKLTDDQLQRFLSLWDARQRHSRPTSWASRLFRPAKTERKLVLFTLAIVVVLIVLTILVLETSDNADADAITALIGLAGTGVGFIGGMVTSESSGQGAAASRVND